MRAAENQTGQDTPEWLAVVARQVCSTRFGVVQVIIHDGHVVQVEKTEKLRFEIGALGSKRHGEADRYSGG